MHLLAWKNLSLKWPAIFEQVSKIGAFCSVEDIIAWLLRPLQWCFRTRPVLHLCRLLFASEYTASYLPVVSHFDFTGQKRVSEDTKRKILQHIGTFLFHILRMENIYGTCKVHKVYAVSLYVCYFLLVHCSCWPHTVSLQINWFFCVFVFLFQEMEFWISCLFCVVMCLQCFDAVCWATGRASGL